MENIRDIFIGTAVTLGESLGLNRAVCQIYALLYFSEEPLSPTQIGEILSMSKGNISISMRTLEQWNAVKKVWRKGYARALYQANGDIEGVVLDKLKTGLNKRLSVLKEAVSEMKQKLDNKGRKTEGSVSRAFYVDRFARVDGFVKKVQFLIDNLDYLKKLSK